MASIKQLQQSVLEAKQEINELKAAQQNDRHKLYQVGREASSLIDIIKGKLQAEFDRRLNLQKVSSTQDLDKYPPYFSPFWQQSRWQDYSHRIPAAVPFMTCGYKAEEQQSPFTLPSLIPFIGQNKTIGIPYTAGNDKDKETKLHVLQNLLERAALMLPHSCTFCLIDPEMLNASFPIQKSLPHVRLTDLEISRTLKEILGDISRINQEFLTHEITSFEQLPDQIRSTERFECIFVANFPKDYDRRAIEYLVKISKTGPQAGKYLFIHYDRDHELASGQSMADFANLIDIEREIAEQKSWGVPLKRFWTMPARPEVNKLIFDGLRAARPVEHNLEFEEITPSDPEKFWQDNAAREIRVPIGGAGSNHILDLWFGTAIDKRQCSHGMLGAMTGSGKSNLYHVFICGLISRYSPEEVGLYLVDGKQGVEFQVYQNLPHAQVVSLNTTANLARSVLAELVDIMERRNQLFQDVGVVDLAGYREKGSPGGKLPRLLLIADEFQTFFEADREGLGSKLVLALASQGRSAGIHMFIGSQRFGAPNMLSQSAIFGNMHLRVAMKMSNSDIAALTEFGKLGKARIRTCDSAGKVVINDAAGDDGANHSGKVAFLSDENRAEFVNNLIDEFTRRFPDDTNVGAVLFNGKEQPIQSSNPQLKKFFKLFPSAPSKEDWQNYAQTPEFKQGLGVSEWYSGEAPSAFWLGQDFTIHGQTKVILRRRAGENLLIAGESTEARLGMCSAILSAAALNHRGLDAQVYLLDRTVVGSPWHGILGKVAAEYLQPLGINLNSATEANMADTMFDEVLATIESRDNLPEDEIISCPPIYLILFEAQRLSSLEKTLSHHGMKQSSELSEKLSDILVKGPDLGVHSIISYSGVRNLQQSFNQDEISRFRHKVALQMSEDESFNFIRSRTAAGLQNNGKRPIIALYNNASAGDEVKFKPYCYFEHQQQAFFEDLDKLFSHVRTQHS